MADTIITPASDEKVRPTLQFFPQMMQASRMLIIDFDVTRFHSFDFLRRLLLEKDRVTYLDERMIPLLKIKDYYNAIIWYKTHCFSLNPWDAFVDTHDQMTLEEVENANRSLFSDPKCRITATELMNQLSIIFDRKDITGYLLRYPMDKTEIPWLDKVTVYTSEHMLNMKMAAAIVQKHQINAIMISSVEAAVRLISYLHMDFNYYAPITFFIADYQYNYDPELEYYKMGPLLYQLQMQYFYEFCTFNPFSVIGEYYANNRNS